MVAKKTDCKKEDKMKLIIGLGNPGQKYSSTRHNIGFKALDFLADDKNWSNEKKLNSLINETKINNEKILLAKPQTFMNNSGQAVKKIINYYKINLDDCLIICDDIDLYVGQIRLRKDGSSGGHNGLSSIFENLGSQNIARLKIGIAEEKSGKQDMPSEDYVLRVFGKDTQKALPKIFKEVFNLVNFWLRGETSVTTKIK